MWLYLPDSNHSLCEWGPEGQHENTVQCVRTAGSMDAIISKCAICPSRVSFFFSVVARGREMPEKVVSREKVDCELRIAHSAAGIRERAGSLQSQAPFKDQIIAIRLIAPLFITRRR